MLFYVESNQGLSQSSHQLRCLAPLLPFDHPQYRPLGEKELEYSAAKWYALVLSLVMPANKADKIGIVSAPLWDSHTSTFAGLLTTSDYINVIQYYWQNPDALGQIDQFRLSSLRGIVTRK